MRILSILILLTVACTSCISKKERNLMSPCTAIEAYGSHFNGGAGTNPCVKRPINTWLS